MTKLLKSCLVLFTGLCFAGCMNPGINSKSEVLLTYSAEPAQEFIDVVGDLAVKLASCDAISQSTRPPLVVIRPMETDGMMFAGFNKYLESEQNTMIAKTQGKARFIDKETTEEADYYLYSVICNTGTRQEPVQLEAGGTTTISVLTYKIKLNLIDAHTAASVFKGEAGFTPKYTIRQKMLYKKP